MPLSFAIVRPRVRLPGGDAAIPLDRVVRDALRKTGLQTIGLRPDAFGGTTSAIRYVESEFRNEARVFCFRKGQRVSVPPESHDAVVVASWDCYLCLSRGPSLLLRLVGWTDDDLAEYLLATERARVAELMAIVKSMPDRARLDGRPRLWRLVLDELRVAPAPSSPSAVATLLAAFDRRLAGLPPELKARCCERKHLTATSSHSIVWAALFGRDHAFRSAARDDRFVTCWNTRAIVHAIARGENFTAPTVLTQTMVTDIADLNRCETSIESAVRSRWVEGMSSLAQPLLASVLANLDADWRPINPRPSNLARASLRGVHWPGVSLAVVFAPRADFAHANLQKADFSGARLENADFSSADLRRAKMSIAQLSGAVLRAANLQEANLSGSTLFAADLERADLTQADLSQARLWLASVRGACFRRANLTAAQFHGESHDDPDADGVVRRAFIRVPLGVERPKVEDPLDDADFRGAILHHAFLRGMDLRSAMWDSAEFDHATLSKCNLTEMKLPGARMPNAKLDSADLTAAFLPGANLQGASLREALLADINLERADLRGADLSFAVFHMGSSRSGLVDSPIACEGSKTGFYDQPTFDEQRIDPERVRKANLRGADLRGAKIDGLDFYLVDLRDALYDADLEPILRRCGAILESRVE
ncbi:MAG: pentapeptide repeat-containing protein [Phycisphaerae bacterium]|nr:pentapeptide repeat-containing protein [Phycisphaerae bacterium]